MTAGYILYGPEFDMTRLMPAIVQQYASFCHPLAIPLLMAELMIDYLTAEFVLVDEKLEDTEITTRKMEREDKKAANSSNWIPAGYHSMAFDLGEQSSNFALLNARIETAIASQKFLLSQIRWMRQGKFPKNEKFDESSTLLGDRIQYTLDNLEQMLRYNSIEKRLQAHQNYVSQLANYQSVIQFTQSSD